METEHESYGLISFNRAQSTAAPLFGSSIKHNSLIQVEITEAKLDRHLSRDWMHPGRILLRGVMSPNQFAELITQPNSGVGTPLTLEYVNGDDKIRREPPPFVDKRSEFVQEMTEHMAEVLEQLKDLRADAKTNKMRDKINLIIQQVEKNTPFVEAQFNKQMDKTVVEAKAEFETFVSQRLHEMGVTALAEGMLPQLPEAGEEGQ